jgi:biotin carboxyl carrier protein
MTFEIEVDGRLRGVIVERCSDGAHSFRVTVDGVVHLVNAVQPARDAWSLIDSGSARSHDIALARGTGPGEVFVSLAGHTVAAVVNGRRARRGGETGAGAGAQRVTAPMPGKVLRVLVQPGDEVSARQPLIVVEAMKMENELRAARAGRVTEVAVCEQTPVEAGQLLAVIDS